MFVVVMVEMRRGGWLVLSMSVRGGGGGGGGVEQRGEERAVCVVDYWLQRGV